MKTKEQKIILNLLYNEENKYAIERLEEEFELINTEEYLLDKIKDLKENGSVWFKNELKTINIKMSIAEAKRINGLIIGHALHEIVENTNSSTLKGISLQDMLDALTIIKNIQNKVYKNDDGTQYQKMFIKADERLIAALYVANNYDGGTHTNPDLVALSNDRYVLVIKKHTVKEI